MGKLVVLQKQIAYTLIDKMESQELTTDRATEIARKIELLLPNSLSDIQVDEVIPQIICIPELSGVGFNLG